MSFEYIDKLDGSVVSERMVACTEHQIGKEQCVFTHERKHVDHMFVLRIYVRNT